MIYDRKKERKTKRKERQVRIPPLLYFLISEAV
jgi:hypothetical protein